MRKIKGISYRILIFIIFLVSTVAFSGSVSAIELAYDDGICGLVYPEIHGPGTTGGPQQLRQQFLLSDFGLSGDYLVAKVRIYWGPGSPDFAGEIKLRDYDNPNKVVTKSFANPPQDAWQDYDFSGMGFYSNRFYVELWWTNGYGYICVDTSSHHEVSEVDSGTGVWYLYRFPVPYPDGPLTAVDFMIRVDVGKPLGALPVSQCMNLAEMVNPKTGETEKISARVTNDFDGCIIEDSVIFYKGLDCTGDVKPHSFADPESGFVYKSGTRGGCAEAVEVTKGSPVCVQLTLKSGRKTTVCY
jgi:hypothetical protein